MEESTEEMRRLLEVNIVLVERLSRFVCRNKLHPDEVEEFASSVKLRLVENDYAILRKFEGRSSLPTYLTIVIRRLFSDYQTHHHGKWHTSAAAQRLGTEAVELERLLYRDGKTLDEAVSILAAKGCRMSRGELERLADQVPVKRRHASFVSAEDVETEPAVTSEPIESNAMADDRVNTAKKVDDVLRSALSELTTEERAILRMHFVGKMSVAEVARALQVDQKPLYRRIHSIQQRLRKKVEQAGINAAEVMDLIGRSDSPALDFGLQALGNRAARSSSMSGSERGRDEQGPT